MAILVTGAAGFIGCNNVLALNRQGYSDVIAVDNLSKSEKFLNLAKCQISDFLKEVWPFILCLFIVLLLITFFPALVTFVPNLIYG